MMKFSVKLFYVSALALAIAFSGCNKKSRSRDSSSSESKSDRSESSRGSGSQSSGEDADGLLDSTASGLAQSVNPNGVAMNGRKLIMGIIQANIDREGKADPVWPKEKDAGDSSDEGELDIASKCGSATEYFNALFDMGNGNYGTPKWDPAVDGELISTLGKNAVAGDKINPKGLDWCIALNIQDETPDFMPVLISANFNPKLLAGSSFSGRDDTCLQIGPKSGAAKSMFGDEAIVIVRKSGAAEVLRKKYVTRRMLYQNQSFDNSALKKQIKWLTPAGVVTPVGHE